MQNDKKHVFRVALVNLDISMSTSGRFYTHFLVVTKSSIIRCKTLFLLVKVAEFIWPVAKLGHSGPQSLWPASKPTYIYEWAHEVENSKHIALRSASTSGGFWGTTKSSVIRCKLLFFLVKVAEFIWFVTKLGHNGPQSLWPASKSTVPVSMCGLMRMRVLDISYSGVQALPEDFGELQSLQLFNASGCSLLSSLLYALR
jgi:hypothetical protein